MRRLFASAALVVLAGLPACTCEKDAARGEQTSASPTAEQPVKVEDMTPVVDLAELHDIPADAELVAHIDLRRLLASPLWQANQGLMTGDPEAKRTLDALDTCELGLDTLSTLDLGVDSRGQHVVASLKGAAIGEVRKLKCIGETLFGGDENRWAIKEADGVATIELDGGAAIGHVAAADRLVFASSAWDRAVAERIAGGGHSPAVGTLGETLQGLNTDRTIWFAGRLPMVTGQAENLRSLSGAVDLDDGLALELGMVAASPQLAVEISGELDRRLGNIRTRLKKAKLPESAVDRITLKVDEATVQLRAALDIAEITTIRELMTLPEADPPAGADDPKPAQDAP